MARAPFAVWRPIPSTTDPSIEPIGVILHVDAGDAYSLYNWFSGPSKGIESHFHIAKDGRIEQYRDTSQEADANYQANSFMRDGRRVGFISIETQGYASGEWTDVQLVSIKRLLTWVDETHPLVQLRKCPGPFEPGVGYHVQFGAPGPWTPSAKTCPGPDRIKQFNEIIVPWMEADMIEIKGRTVRAAKKGYNAWQTLYGHKAGLGRQVDVGDDSWGPAMEDLIRDFQSWAGIPASGQPDYATLWYLGRFEEENRAKLLTVQLKNWVADHVQSKVAAAVAAAIAALPVGDAIDVNAVVEQTVARIRELLGG